jgi:hypothetical protein
MTFRLQYNCEIKYCLKLTFRRFADIEPTLCELQV